MQRMLIITILVNVQFVAHSMRVLSIFQKTTQIVKNQSQSFVLESCTQSIGRPGTLFAQQMQRPNVASIRLMGNHCKVSHQPWWTMLQTGDITEFTKQGLDIKAFEHGPLNNMSLLQLAAHEGNLSLVQELLKCEEPAAASYRPGSETALWFACFCRDKEKAIAVARILLDAIKDPIIRQEILNRELMRAAHYANGKFPLGFQKVFQMLLMLGADINFLDTSEKSALQVVKEKVAIAKTAHDPITQEILRVLKLKDCSGFFEQDPIL